jgi:hypothetical protein
MMKTGDISPPPQHSVFELLLHSNSLNLVEQGLISLELKRHTHGYLNGIGAFVVKVTDKKNCNSIIDCVIKLQSNHTYILKE